MKEPQKQSEETELLHALETERVRLSLVEEKLVDVLQLLQQLRDLVSGNSCVSQEHCSLWKEKKKKKKRHARTPPALLVSFMVATYGLDQRFSTGGSQPRRSQSCFDWVVHP